MRRPAPRPASAEASLQSTARQPRSEALAEAAARLRAAGIADAAREARLLFRHVTGLSPAALAAEPGSPVSTAEARRFAAALDARAGRRPLAQITGRRAFWGRDFAVTPDVLDPRPETETLVAAALERPYTHVLDLGTGSGCLLLTLLAERPGSHGLGTDLSGPALAVASANAARLGLAARAAFVRADWLAGLPLRRGGYDLIISNPPYIAATEIDGLAPEVAEHEPRQALTPGPDEDGLGSYRAIAAALGPALAPQGRAILEVGRGQAMAVGRILAAAGFRVAAPRCDLDQVPRAIVAIREQNLASGRIGG